MHRMDKRAPNCKQLTICIWALTFLIAETLMPTMALAREFSGDANRIDPEKRAGLSSFVDGVMAEEIATRGVSGAIVTVVDRDKVLLSNGYGFADVDKSIPVNPRTAIFRPGSVSKIFTWTALLQQVELGRIDLDADVENYLDFKIPRISKDKIRVRDLMSHSAGFGDQSNIFADSFKDVVPFELWIKKNIATQVRAPGAEISYSNYGAALAGYIVERVSGEPFADYVQKHIFQPLGMVDTTFVEPLAAPQENRLAKAYKMVDGHFVSVPFEFISQIMPAGSSSTTAPDMARFMKAILQGGILGSNRILKESSVKLFESDLLANTPDLPGMAHGFQVLRESDPRILKHRGDTLYYHSYVVLVPEAGLGIFVSMTVSPNSGPVDEELVHAIVGHLFPEKPMARWMGPEVLVPVGSYRSNRQDYSQKPNPLNDIQVKVPGPHAVITVQNKISQYWEQVGPHLYEDVTGAREGGPYDRLEFYGPADDPRLSFALRPQMVFHFVRPENGS